MHPEKELPDFKYVVYRLDGRSYGYDGDPDHVGFAYRMGTPYPPATKSRVIYEEESDLG